MQEKMQAIVDQYMANLPSLKAKLMRAGVDDSTADDICQDMALKLLEDPERVDMARSVEAFMGKITKRKQIDRWRRPDTRAVKMSALRTDGDHAFDPADYRERRADDIASVGEIKVILGDELGRLARESPKELDVLAEVYLNQSSDTEGAKALRVPRKTFVDRRNRGLAKLEKRLRRRGIDG